MESKPEISTLDLEDINLTQKKRQKRTYFTANEKQMVLNVHEYVRQTWPMDEYPYKISIMDKTANILGIAVASVYRILKEYAKNGEFKGPSTTKKRLNFSEKIDECDKNAIRKKVHGFFLKGEIPTFKKVLKAINEDEELPNFKRSTFYKTLKELKFKYIKLQGKNALIDRDDIILWRTNYLKKMTKYRTENRPIFYVDETRVNIGHAVSKTDVETKGTSVQPAMEGQNTGAKNPASIGKQLVVVHIGNENGFVKSADFFQIKLKNAVDDQESMDAIRFERWFESILPKLSENAVVVLDNAPYYSRRQDTSPNATWRKSSIQEWLRSKEVKFDENDVKAELLKKVKDVKLNYQSYAVDELAKKYKVEVLRLPPYHCELNPIALVWPDVKGYVARNNTTFKLEEVQKLLKEGIENVSADKWRNCVDQIIKVENIFCSKIDNMVDNIVDSFDTNMADSDSSDESGSSSDTDNY